MAHFSYHDRNDHLMQVDVKKKRVREQTDYEDLREEPVAKKDALKLAKGERYLTGPTPASSNLTSGSDNDMPYIPPDDARSAILILKMDL